PQEDDDCAMYFECSMILGEVPPAFVPQSRDYGEAGACARDGGSFLASCRKSGPDGHTQAGSLCSPEGCDAAGGSLRQIIPSFIRPASLIMFWFQGGSQTSCTSASSTPSIVKILLWASCAIAGPIPQPGAVNVIFTSTRVPPPSFFVSLQS